MVLLSIFTYTDATMKQPDLAVDRPTHSSVKNKVTIIIPPEWHTTISAVKFTPSVHSIVLLNARFKDVHWRMHKLNTGESHCKWASGYTGFD